MEKNTSENVKESEIKMIWSRIKSEQGLLWAQTQPPSKFRRNLFNRFCVILLTNRLNNKQTSSHGREHNLLPATTLTPDHPNPLWLQSNSLFFADEAFKLGEIKYLRAV